MTRLVLLLVVLAGCGGRSRPLCDVAYRDLKPGNILQEEKGDSGPGRRCR